MLYNLSIEILIGRAIGLLLGFTLHEFAHAWTADRLGDRTPYYQGRLTLDPRAHIDPMGIILALLVVVAIAFFTSRTTSGYELIVTGANPRASKVHGINIKRMFLFSMILGAACAGLAGAIEVAGVHHRLIEGLHSNFATLGLIIGLIARGKNGAVPFVAFFIAILEVGGSAMQRTVMVPVQIVLIAEALILIFVLLSDIIKRRRK